MYLRAKAMGLEKSNEMKELVNGDGEWKKMRDFLMKEKEGFWRRGR